MSCKVIKNDAVTEIYIDTAGSQPFIMHLWILDYPQIMVAWFKLERDDNRL